MLRATFAVVVVVVLVGVAFLCLALSRADGAEAAPGTKTELGVGTPAVSAALRIVELGLFWEAALGLALRARIGEAVLLPGAAGCAAAAGRFSVMGRAMGVAGALMSVILAVGVNDAV